MIIERRSPSIETEPVNWAAAYDQELKNNLDGGMADCAAEAKAFATCSMLWLQQNPMHSDYVAMGNKGVCCFCGSKGADVPLSILGTGVFAHSGQGRPSRYEMKAKREPGCWDAVVWQLARMARAGLEFEGLVIEIPEASPPTEPDDFKPYVPA